MTYPNGRVNTYAFDNNHLPSTIVSNSTTVATYTFNGVNAPTTKTLGNTVSLNIEYNNRYQISKHDWKLNGNTIAGYNYGHDSVGNRIWSENLVNANKSELFAFDNADRLTSFKTGTLNANKDNIVAPTYLQGWILDSIGNWSQFNDNGTNSVNSFSDTHAMTTFKGVTNTFDNNGNLTSDGVRTFKYDAFNRIIEVKVGVIILAQYQYDAFNRRVVKKVDADLNSSFETTVKFLYDGFRCIEELNASDALSKEYVYGSLYIDEVILQRTGATDYYFTHDYRYSVTNLTNSAGNIVESYDYKVYGERTASGSGLTTVGYTGQRHDSETGLMYFKNRYYSTSTGSFVTRDPHQKDASNRKAMDGYQDGMSLYLGYFGIDGVDPLGLITDEQYESSIPWSRSEHGSADFTMPGVNPIIPSISGTDYLGDLARSLGMGTGINHGSSNSLLTLASTAGEHSQWEAIKAGRRIASDMNESGKCKFKLLAHSQGVRNTTHAGRRFADKYCNKSCGHCPKVIIRMVLIAPKTSETSIRNAIEYMKKKCKKLDVKAMVIYSRSDSVIPVGGSFPWPGNYGRMNGANLYNNDVDGDGEEDIIELPARFRNVENSPNWLDSHLVENLLDARIGKEHNAFLVSWARWFLDEAN